MPTDHNQTEKTAKTDWAKVLLFVAAGVAAAFQIGKAPPVLPILRDELSMSLFAAGWVLSAFSVLGLALGPAAGAVADWLGHRRLMLFGLLIQAAASAVGSTANGPTLLLATRFLEGLGFIFVVVTAPSLIVQSARPADLRMAIGIWGCFMPTGAAIMMILAPLVVPSLGWRGFWLFNSGLLVLLSLGIALATRGLVVRANPGRLRTLLSDVKRTVTTPGPLLLALCFSTYTMQFLGVVGFLPTFLVEQGGLSTFAASLLAALVMGSNVVGNLWAGRMLTMGTPRWRLIAIAGVAMAVSSIFIFSNGMPLTIRYLACLAFSAVGGLWPVAVLMGAVSHAPEPRLVGASQGLLMQGSQLGNVLGPPLLALVVSAGGGWQATPWLLCSAGALGLALGGLLGRLELRTGIK